MPEMSYIDLLSRCILLEGELKTERERADRWQQLAGHYDDMRYALRNCSDDPVGHRQFYRDCARMIFGDYWFEEDDDVAED
jgi:hypothetical protein